MRRNLLVTASITVGLAACSRPAPEPVAANRESGRDLQMVEPTAPTTPASDLEVGRRPLPAAPRAVSEHPQHQPDQMSTGSPIAASALAAIALDGAPTLSATAATEVSPATRGIEQTLVQAPAAVEMFPAGGLRPAPIGVGIGPVGSTYAGRGPTIIIRGGRGGIDDDCDLDRPGIHGHGAAVNRSTPAFGGGLGGQVPRIGGRFPRGIR